MGEQEKSMELEIRRKVYNYILRNPGLHERELSRRLKISLSTLDYHLYFLKKRNLITGKASGHYTRYYTSGKIGLKEEKIISALRKKFPRKIIIFLLTEKAATHKQICSHLGVAASTTSFHLKKLTDMKIISREETGRESNFKVVNPDHVTDIIISHKKSFLDDAVGRFVDTWLELHPRNIKKK